MEAMKGPPSLLKCIFLDVGLFFMLANYARAILSVFVCSVQTKLIFDFFFLCNSAGKILGDHRQPQTRGFPVHFNPNGCQFNPSAIQYN